MANRSEIAVRSLWRPTRIVLVVDTHQIAHLQRPAVEFRLRALASRLPSRCDDTVTGPQFTSPLCTLAQESAMAWFSLANARTPRKHACNPVCLVDESRLTNNKQKPAGSPAPIVLCAGAAILGRGATAAFQTRRRRVFGLGPRRTQCVRGRERKLVTELSGIKSGFSLVQGGFHYGSNNASRSARIRPIAAETIRESLSRK